jgi:hypothetical protein
MIKNTRNGKKYIGSTNNAPRREKNHFKALRKGEHHCDYLQRAWEIELDKSVFKFFMFIYCAESQLKLMEQSCFDHMLPEYNVSLIANRPEMNDYTRNKIRETHLSVPEADRKRRALEREANKTPEEKEEHREACSEAAFKRYADASEEQLKDWSTANSQGQKKFWENVSDETRIERSLRGKEQQDAYWRGENSKEKRDKRGKEVKAGLSRMTEEELLERSEASRTAALTRWETATDEQFEAWTKGNSQKAKNYWHGMSDEEYKAACDAFSAGQYNRWANATEVDIQAHKDATSRGQQKRPPEERSAASKLGWETRRKNMKAKLP